nr:flagellar hook-length control protein FliK [Roseibium denhamense]
MPFGFMSDVSVSALGGGKAGAGAASAAGNGQGVPAGPTGFQAALNGTGKASTAKAGSNGAGAEQVPGTQLPKPDTAPSPSFSAKFEEFAAAPEIVEGAASLEEGDFGQESASIDLPPVTTANAAGEFAGVFMAVQVPQPSAEAVAAPFGGGSGSTGASLLSGISDQNALPAAGSGHQATAGQAAGMAAPVPQAGGAVGQPSTGLPSGANEGPAVPVPQMSGAPGAGDLPGSPSGPGTMAADTAVPPGAPRPSLPLATPDRAPTPSAEPGTPSGPETTERRWQTGLPVELRASQAPILTKAVSSPASPTQAPVIMAAAQQADPVLPVGSGGPEVVAQKGRVTALPPAAVPTEGDAVSEVPQVALPTKQAPQAPSPESPARNAQLAAGPLVQPQANQMARVQQAPPGSAVPIPDAGFDPSAGDAPLDPLPEPLPLNPRVAGASLSNLAEKGTHAANNPQSVGSGAANPAGAPTGLPAGQAQIAKAAPDVAGLAAPVEDRDLALDFRDFSSSTDFTATIRGGDSQGAARLESLQLPNQAQSGQVAAQVAVEMARNLKNGQNRFQMRFDPPELGRVEVNMRVSADGSVQAHLIVERPETLDMFLRDQRGLERALEAAGLNADNKNLEFSLRQDGGQQFASGDGQADDRSAQGQGKSDGADGMEPVEAVPDPVIRMALAAQRGGLDVQV